MPPQDGGTAPQEGGLGADGAGAGAAAAAVAVGCTVLIDGLKSKPELNGMKGVVTAKKEPRWVVQPNGEGLAPLALKEANITVVLERGADASSAETATPPGQTQDVRVYMYI